MLQSANYDPAILCHAAFRPERKNQRLAQELTRRYRTLYCGYLLVGGSRIRYTAREESCGANLENQADWSLRAAIVHRVTLVLLHTCYPDPESISRVREIDIPGGLFISRALPGLRSTERNQPSRIFHSQAAPAPIFSESSHRSTIYSSLLSTLDCEVCHPLGHKYPNRAKRKSRKRKD